MQHRDRARRRGVARADDARGRHHWRASFDRHRHQLDSSRCERGARTDQPLVLAAKPVRQRGRVDVVRRDGVVQDDRQCVHLAREAQRHPPLDRNGVGVVGGDVAARSRFEIGQRRRQQLHGALERFGAQLDFGQRAQVGRGRAVRRENGCQRRDHDLAHAEIFGVAAGILRRRAPVRVEREVGGIVTALHGRTPHQIGHLRVGDPQDVVCDLVDALAPRSARGLGQWAGKLAFDRRPGGCRVQRQLPAESIEVTQRNGGIGDRRQPATAPVAHRPGIGAGRLRTHAQRTGGVIDPRDGSAPGTDRREVDHRRRQRIHPDHWSPRKLQASIGNDAHVEARTTDIGRDDVGVAEPAPEIERRRDAADRT